MTRAAAKKSPDELPWSAARCMVALGERYKAPEFALLPQVRNATGYARTTRTADAIAMSLWPSRGLELHGFEIKSARHDWIREVRDPAKAEEIASRCDRWWIVAGADDLVQPGELPPTWGLLVRRGNALVVAVEAPKLEAAPIDRSFLAALLRKASEVVVTRAEIDAAVVAERERVYEEAKANAERTLSWEHQGTQTDLENLRRRVAEFEKKSGVTIDRWSYGDVGAAVRFLTANHDSATAPAERMRRFVEEQEKLATEARRALVAIENTENQETPNAST